MRLLLPLLACASALALCVPTAQAQEPTTLPPAAAPVPAAPVPAAVPPPATPALFPDSLAAPAGPFFVVAGSFRSKASAQQVAHRSGAWVLRSDRTPA